MMWFIFVPFHRQKLRTNDPQQVTLLGRTWFLDSLSSAHSPAPVRGPMELIKADLPPLAFFVADPRGRPPTYPFPSQLKPMMLTPLLWGFSPGCLLFLLLTC